MQIPFHKPFITDDEIKAVTEAINNGWLTMGPKTIEFENQFKQFLKSKEAVAVNSCTAALHLALECINLKKNEEVIVPSITHTSTAEVVGYFNARPVIIDVERDTHLIDAAKIENKITKKTRAIIPVHYAGQPADIDTLSEIALKYNLYIIGDAAHAFPSKYKDKYIGTTGDITCFSFYATKPLSTGEGGMATTENKDWADRMRILRLHGVSRDAWKREEYVNTWEYDVLYAGFKYNTTDMSAAMGIEQLKKADDLLRRRERIADKYDNAFRDNDGLYLYKIKDQRQTSWHLYPLKLNLDYLSIDRDRFIIEMKNRGIATSVHYIPLYRFTYYKKFGYNPADFPESEYIFQRTFSLPIYPGMSDDEVDYVCDSVLDIIKKFER